MTGVQTCALPISVEKSPEFKMIYVDYMLALIKNGDFHEAMRQYNIASSIPSVGYYEMLDLAMASALSKDGNYSEATKYYEIAIDKTKGKSVKVYELYRNFLRERLVEVNNDELICNPYFKKKLECLDALFELQNEPSLMFRAGELSLIAGDNVSAIRYFKKVISSASSTSSYHKNAVKLLNRLECVER